MGGYGSGGRNKTHGQLEKFHRIDSFAFYDCLMGDKYLQYKTDVKYPPVTGDVVYHVGDRTAEIRTGDFYSDLPLSRVRGIDGQSVRMYFHCPHCKRRVRYLYLRKGCYKCRSCAKLNYACQQKNGMDELRLKMENIVENKLQYTHWRRTHPDGCIQDLWHVPKPPYMRWKKYEKLMRELRQLQKEYEREFLTGCLRYQLSRDIAEIAMRRLREL